MLYIGADIHGSTEKLRDIVAQITADVRLQSEAESPVLLICGDFGKPFLNTPAEHRTLDEINEIGVEIGFVDGNHENHDFLANLPVSKWHGGKVHSLRPHIHHLMRGQLYQICGKSVFTMGGAASVDKLWRLSYERSFGKKIWWQNEVPSEEEIRTARDTLEAANYEVDLILSHTAPQSVQRIMGYVPTVPDIALTSFLEWTAQNVQFEKWVFGHFHEDRNLGRYSCIFEHVIKI